jgi:hypothetical protein
MSDQGDRNLHVTTNNNYKRQIFKTPAGFKPAIRASERQQTHALDRTTIGIKDLQIFIIIMLGGTQSWYGHFEDTKNLLTLQDIKFRFLHFAV